MRGMGVPSWVANRRVATPKTVRSHHLNRPQHSRWGIRARRHAQRRALTGEAVQHVRTPDVGNDGQVPKRSSLTHPTPSRATATPYRPWHDLEE